MKWKPTRNHFTHLLTLKKRSRMASFGMQSREDVILRWHPGTTWSTVGLLYRKRSPFVPDYHSPTFRYAVRKYFNRHSEV